MLLLVLPLPEFELLEEVLMYSALTKPVVLLYLILCQPLLVDIICTVAFLPREPIILLLVLAPERTFRASALTIPLDLTVLSEELLLLLLVLPLPEVELPEEALMYSALTKPVVLLYLILCQPLLVDIICTLAFLEREPIILLLVLSAERTFKAVAVTIPVLDACTVLELLSSFTYSPEIQPVVLL